MIFLNRWDQYKIVEIKHLPIFQLNIQHKLWNEEVFNFDLKQMEAFHRFKLPQKKLFVWPSRYVLLISLLEIVEIVERDKFIS